MSDTQLILSLFAIQMGFIGFMWNRIDKRFDRLESKIDTLFDKFADIDKRVTVLEKIG